MPHLLAPSHGGTVEDYTFSTGMPGADSIALQGRRRGSGGQWELGDMRGQRRSYSVISLSRRQRILTTRDLREGGEYCVVKVLPGYGEERKTPMDPPDSE
jgi:hypothetical protein